MSIKKNNCHFLYFIASFLVVFFIFQTASAVTIVSSNLSTNTTWTASNSPYIVQNSVEINSGATLTIEPGVVVKFFDENSRLYANGGHINAQGDGESKIYFTSIKDDSVGGDTNGDGNLTTPTKFDAGLLDFRNSNSRLHGVVVRYCGGYSGFGVRVNISNVEISNSSISDSGNGIFVSNKASELLRINNSEIFNGAYGISGSGNIIVTNSSFHDNSFRSIYNFNPPLVIQAENNWWGNSSGPHHPTLNSSGTGGEVSDGVDFTPWLASDPFAANNLPTLSGLMQLKLDGVTPVNENSVLTESTVVFKGTLLDSDNGSVKLQVELKEFGQTFDESNTLESNLESSGSGITITKNSLPEGAYHWRARAVDGRGGSSVWQEFGTAGNMDFEVKLVPLYTQVRSPYPSDEETFTWSELDYAKGPSGNYNCGSKIKNCGCAIASAVMIARYYDILETQGKDVNPGEINQWLNDNDGYQNGNVNWISVAQYTGWKIKYEKTDTTISNYALLDEKLINSQPVIAYTTSTRGNIGRSHFFVINNKLTSTYNVKDPAWYNTKTLDESDSYQDKVLAQTAKIRDYENGFDGLRIYKKGDGIAQSAIIIALGSPAELLITDSQGRKIGKDNSGVEYNEIPNASYVEEGFNDPFGEDLAIQEKNKVIQILEPGNGRYELQVIGTGEGSYSLDFNFYDTQGSTTHQEFHSETAPTYIAQYDLLFNASNSASTTIELADEMPPEAEIVFNPTSQKLEIQGVDDITVHPTFSFIENEEGSIYQIQDEAENTTKLFFKKLKQEGKEIKTELEAMQYNNDPIIYTEADLKYEWSLNKDGAIKELEQMIKSGDVFNIKATYNQQKSETEVKIKQGEQEEIEQTFPGLKIIKLITKSGGLGFSL